MTIGEKIKYFRSRMGITQAKLADLTGIHPVSIRKYETNRMVPQAQQIDRIAEALCVSSFAISGIDNNIRLETIGDFMGLLIMLVKTNIVTIIGERADNDLLKAETLSLRINPFISQFFTADISNNSIEASNIIYRLKAENLLDDFLKWERINFRLENILSQKDGNIDDITASLIEAKESVEMELQRSNLIPE